MQSNPSSPEKYCRNLVDSALLNKWRNKKTSPVIISTAVLWAQVTISWFLSLNGPSWLYAISFLINCACISAMQLWVHESSHFNLFDNRKLNDLWASIFFASPIGMSIKIYRLNHFTHHAKLGAPEDLDRYAFNVDIQGNKKLFYKVLKGLLLIDAWEIIFNKYYTKTSGFKKKDYVNSFFILFWNLLFFGLCIFYGRWYLYFLLWAYPILGIAVTINSIRSIAEHQPFYFRNRAGPQEFISPITRSTNPSFIVKYFFYQANNNYHYEHHLYPTIPAYNLPKFNKLLNGFYCQNPCFILQIPIKMIFQLSKNL